jgi:hypothetical protein
MSRVFPLSCFSGRDTGLPWLLVPNLLTGGKGADLVIRGNVVLNTLSACSTSTLLWIRSASTLRQAGRSLGLVELSYAIGFDSPSTQTNGMFTDSSISCCARAIIRARRTAIAVVVLRRVGTALRASSRASHVPEPHRGHARTRAARTGSRARAVPCCVPVASPVPTTDTMLVARRTETVGGAVCGPGVVAQEMLSVGASISSMPQSKRQQ